MKGGEQRVRYRTTHLQAVAERRSSLERGVGPHARRRKRGAGRRKAPAQRSGIYHIPAIIEFLGYNPLPEAKSLTGQLIRHRTSLGMSQKEAARRMLVDAGTLARWERDEREPQAGYWAASSSFSGWGGADMRTTDRVVQARGD